MKYIYESPDKGKTIYRRKFGDYNSPRELTTEPNKQTNIMTEYLNYWIKLVKDTPNNMELGGKVREIINNKNEKNKNMNMISLYDYLGHAAGSELGQKVATAARASGVNGEIREVANPKYTGPVMLWPRAFLDLYFKGGLNEGTSGKQLLKG